MCVKTVNSFRKICLSQGLIFIPALSLIVYMLKDPATYLSRSSEIYPDSSVVVFCVLKFISSLKTIVYAILWVQTNRQSYVSHHIIIMRQGYLYPRHLCRRVYSFRFSVCPFVCSFVRSFVSSVEFASKFWLKFL